MSVGGIDLCLCTVLSLKRFIVQTVYTVCIMINYKIVLVINLNKYSHYGTIGIE
jgi:hypothetical protein